ncbi:Mitochondrial protein [Fragilaria crotonensis]|nr:Mitochondrial protein [Fragilaria crotonensis]
MPEPMIIESIEEEFVEESATNPILEALNELPEAAIQQPVRMLPPIFPEPPLRHLNPLAPVHQRPYAMFQDPAHHPSSALMFSEATLDDPLNGTIHLRDLPLCIEISTTIAAFCLNFLAAPPEVHHIRDITSPDMKPISRHITLRHQMPSPNSSVFPRRQVLPTRHDSHSEPCYQLANPAFHRRTTLLLTFGIPDKYYDITRDFYENPPYCPMETKCAVGLIYALRLYYITHHRHSTYHRHGFRQHDLYPKHLFQIAKDIKSTAAALSFRSFPAFCIPYRGLKRYRKMFRVELNFARANPYLVAYTNSFRLDDEEQRSIALRTAQTIIRLALFEHGLINRKTRRRSREPELSNNRFHIGNLPPADLFLSNFATCFPMITRPSLVQLDLDDVNDDTLAINYVVCQPLDFLQLFTLQPTEANEETYYMDVYSDLTPVPTNGINFSIDFLPHFEYILYRVAQLVNPKDPTGILPRNHPPPHVIMFQGSPLASNSYSNGSSTEIAKPTARAGIFPTTLNHDQQPIISNRDGEPYNRLSVQALFKVQLAKPILSHHIGDPDWIPISAANLRRHPDSSKYHVVRDPKTVPFSLAIRMIPVFTTGPLEESIYQAWALPHLIDALRDPEIQLFNNHLSYYYNEKESHPEFPFIDQMEPDSPFSANGYNANEPETTVFTHDEPDSEIYTQTDTTSENPTQNDAHSTETHSQQLISDAETTYDEHAQETQQLPGTQPNLAFLPPNSPETSSSHTETPSNSPPTAKSTTGPLKRFSDAFSGILTPKNVKLPHDPATTDSNPQPPISTTFSTTPKIIPSKNLPPRNSNPQPPNPSQNLSQPQTQQSKIIQPPNTKPTKSTQKTANSENDHQTPPENQKLASARPTPRQATHATFAYPPTVDTFFDDDTDHDSEQDPKHIQHTSPDALTSSTRTDFTYPPIEDLTKTLLKYAKNANLRKLAYPTDLQARRRHFNTFIDNLRIVCNISPWTRQVFDLWPKQVSYSHPFVGTALYNLIFTNVCDPCQKHIIDGPPDARTAILTLRRHCAPLTPDHVERTREAFCSIKQPHHEVATSYLNRIRILTRDCYHAGIPNTDAELIKRTVRGGSNHSFYAASYQRFDADIRRAELNDEALPPFAELESHLLNIDESRGLTLPSQNQRNYNQHAHSTRQQSQSRHPQTTHRVFTQRQQQAFSSILRPYTNPNGNNQNRSHPPRPPQNHSRPFRPPTTPSRPPFNNPNQRRPPPPSPRPSNQHQRNNRPPFRPTSNPNQRPSPNGSNINQSRNSASNAATIVCNNCGRLGHYSRNCTNPRSNQNNRASNPQRSTNNENAAPRNQQRAYFVTDSSQDSQNPSRYHHQAFKASSLDHLDDQPDYIPWPNPNLPQMTINQPLLDRDYLPTANHAPPNSGATAYFPDDPQSPYQRFGPPLLENWLPDSGATSHYTPLFSDLSDVEPCSVPISLADGSTKMSTHKGTTACHFTTDDGLKSILGLTDVYFVEGLSHRLLSLTALSCTQNFSVLIKNRATTIQLPNGSTYTWPIITREVPNPHQAFSTTSNPKEPFDLDSEPEEQHFDDTTTPIDTDQRRSITALPLELIYRRLAYRNFRNLMVGSLHQTWNDHVLTPTVDHNSWPLRISISQKRARNKTPQRQGTEPFHRLHLDLMRNPFRYGLTTNSNYSAYLFIVTTPGKLTGWIGLPTESTTSILIALKQWLTDTELLGRTQSVRFIRTDAGSAFTSTKFISECTSLGIKVEAAAPEHQEMNGICEAKWREVHNTANILLNNARLGGAFFHHAHAYAVQILNVCPAKNVIDQDGNPTTPYQYSFQRKPSIANFRLWMSYLLQTLRTNFPQQAHHLQATTATSLSRHFPRIS